MSVRIRLVFWSAHDTIVGTKVFLFPWLAKITFELLRINPFVSSKNKSMKCFPNWIVWTRTFVQTKPNPARQGKERSEDLSSSFIGCNSSVLDFVREKDGTLFWSITIDSSYIISVILLYVFFQYYSTPFRPFPFRSRWAYHTSQTWYSVPWWNSPENHSSVVQLPGVVHTLRWESHSIGKECWTIFCGTDFFLFS